MRSAIATTAGMVSPRIPRDVRFMTKAETVLIPTAAYAANSNRSALRCSAIPRLRGLVLGQTGNGISMSIIYAPHHPEVRKKFQI
jgi:hypothetical protein